MLAPLSSHDEHARPRFARRLVITRYFVLMLREKPLQCIPRCAAAASQSPRRLSAIEDLPVQGVRKLVAEVIPKRACGRFLPRSVRPAQKANGNRSDFGKPPDMRRSKRYHDNGKI